MTNVAPNVFLEFGQTFEYAVTQWEPDKFHSKRNPATYDRYLDMVRLVQMATVYSDEIFPRHWAGSVGGVADGMNTFCAISFMKAAASGYAETPKSTLHDYMLSRDGLSYAGKLGSGNSYMAALTEVEYSLSNHQQSYPHDHPVLSGDVRIADGRLDLKAFNETHERSKEESESKGYTAEVRCQALMHGAFPTIFRAVNLLGVRTGIADDIYDRFADIKKNAPL
jgi:hypothetical protein